jgi:alpha-tubulin suppressor-like RCC1 family protein
MASRSIASLARVCTAAAVIVLGTTAALEISGSTPAAAAGSSVGLFAWGDNSSGELGGGISGDVSATPVTVSLPTGVTPTSIAGGGGSGDPVADQYAGYAIGSDGNLYSWGDNSSGALGDGNTTNSSTPVVVSLPPDVTSTAITAGQGAGYAIGSDGHLYAWGDNPYGALGNGTSGDFSTTPVTVSLPAGVTPTAIAAGYETGYAIGSDGKLYAWGDNFYGELGNGSSPTNSSTPVVVPLPAGVTPTAIAGGGGTGYAIGSDGNLYAWGLNASGQLGDGNTINSPTPVVVSLPSGVGPTAIAGAGGFAYAIGSDGKLYAWGNDSGGQLGDGDTTDSSTPVVVSLPSGVTPKAVTGSFFSGYAIGSDGNLYAWGGNGSGELGDGTTNNSSTPVVVSLPSGGVPEALGPEPGSASAYVVLNAPDVAPAITTEPISQDVVAGQGVTFTAAASGFPAATVQWQVSTDNGISFSPVAGATGDSLTIADTTTAETGSQYEAVFTNGSGVATTAAAVLTVTAATAPVITLQPSDQTVYSGQTETFSAAASGSPTPTAQWQLSVDGGASWHDIPNTASDSFTSLPLNPAVNGWEVRAVFTNVAGSAPTGASVLSVLPAIAPVVTTQPVNQTVANGQTETFSAAASGSPTPTAQWQLSVDGGVSWHDIPNTASDSFTSLPLNPAVNGWEVRAVFTNVAGSAPTDASILSVT